MNKNDCMAVFEKEEQIEQFVEESQENQLEYRFLEVLEPKD